jgi:hypothetical protein
MIRRISTAIVLLALTAVSCAPPRGAAPSAPATEAAPASGYSAEWQQVLAAARSEGTISIMAFPGVGVGDALVDGFQRKYPEIRVDYSGVRERRATQH